MAPIELGAEERGLSLGNLVCDLLGERFVFHAPRRRHPNPSASDSRCGERTATSVMIAEINAQQERKYSPVSNVPVWSLNQATALGPMRPPRLPSELMPAIAAAAAVPLRNVDGSGQNEVFIP